MSTIPKVIRDGKVAVIYSPRYGAGWSSWATTAAEVAVFAPAIVEWIEGGKTDDPAEAVLKMLRDAGLPDDTYIYDGGLETAEIEWVAQGRPFRIEEYDGFESVEIEPYRDTLTA